MAESVISTLVGIIVALASALAGYPAHGGGSEAQPQRWLPPVPLFEREAQQDPSSLRQSIEQWVESLIERLRQEAAAAEPPEAKPQDRPDQFDRETRPGCTLEESSGPGWSSTRVRCFQESRGGSSSNIIVSSSSVNVTSTSTNDAP